MSNQEDCDDINIIDEDDDAHAAWPKEREHKENNINVTVTEHCLGFCFKQ